MIEETIALTARVNVKKTICNRKHINMMIRLTNLFSIAIFVVMSRTIVHHSTVVNVELKDQSRSK